MQQTKPAVTMLLRYARDTNPPARSDSFSERQLDPLMRFTLNIGDHAKYCFNNNSRVFLKTNPLIKHLDLNWMPAIKHSARHMTKLRQRGHIHCAQAFPSPLIGSQTQGLNVSISIFIALERRLWYCRSPALRESTEGPRPLLTQQLYLP